MAQNCQEGQNYKDCILNKVSNIINARGPSRNYTTESPCSKYTYKPYRPKLDCKVPKPAQSYSYKTERNNACSGTEELNKQAFLSMLGVEKFKSQNNVVSFDELQKQKFYEILSKNNGNLKLTAKYFKISLSTLKMKLNKWQSQYQSDEFEKQKFYEILNKNNGNLELTARYFKISVSTLRNKLDQWQSQEQLSVGNYEKNSPNISRKFFENISNPWSIVSFSSHSKDVCVEIKNPSGNSLVYQKLPNLK